MRVIPELCIIGLKKSDLDLLHTIFLEHKDSGEYWGRKDYHEKSIMRLGKWFESINNNLILDKDTKIKEK